jgi:general secretion pathway protein H
MIHWGEESGMTLVEMLVVLAIIGVAASATVLGIGAATREASVQAEARRLASRLQLAADETMINDRPLAFAWDKSGYAFVAWDGGGWRAGEGEAFERHGLPDGMKLDMGKRQPPLMVGIDGTGIPLAARIEGASDSWAVVYDGLKASAMPVPAS